MILKYCLIGLAFLALINAESARRWVEPHAWGRVEQQKEYLDETNSCPSCSCDSLATVGATPDVSSMQDGISYIYYKKLIAFLFNRKNYQYDETSGIFNRALIFSATEDQLQLLESSVDPRDWDAVISELLQNVKRPPNCGHSTSDSLSLLKSFLSWFSLSSEIRFLLLVIAAILAVIYLHKRYRYGLIMITLSGFFMFGFLYTYVDCNRKLQIEEMGEFLDGANDPCAAEKKQSGLWGFFDFFTRGNSKGQCIEHLKKKHRIRLPYCRPDEVFLMYINDVILNQFRLIIEKCTEIIKGSSEKMPFPYNIVAMLIFGFTLTTFLKLTFKHIISPKVWLTGSADKSSNQTHQTHQTLDEPSRDTISGENLRLLLESFKHSVGGSEKRKSPEDQIASGVEVLESLTCEEEKVAIVKNGKNAENLGICSKDSNDDEGNSKTCELCSTEKTEK